MLAQQTIASLPRRRRWLSLSVVSLATLLVTADTGQLSIALPVIIGEFNADLTLASWIALVYALITASLYLPFAGDCRISSESEKYSAPDFFSMQPVLWLRDGLRAQSN